MKGIITSKKVKALEDAYKAAVEDLAAQRAGRLDEGEFNKCMEAHLAICDALGIVPMMKKAPALVQAKGDFVQAPLGQKIVEQKATPQKAKRK